ncbi:hypothetical protein J2S43_003092 [Catenuloplanes nepalensis]|uniref:Secreted protein n=1 Tax=Catenuloplanes nepalensis TaxID=587533 RepID=A0ABT9MT43_9ACTN|nr:hypothetical protein [Catenuloplanes nepalensis]MDP9794580.1 hypothetical protein [Catenuloplanes nepalensis]
MFESLIGVVVFFGLALTVSLVAAVWGRFQVWRAMARIHRGSHPPSASPSAALDVHIGSRADGGVHPGTRTGDDPDGTPPAPATGGDDDDDDDDDGD